MKKLLSLLLCLSLAVAVPAAMATAPEIRFAITNPYEAVDWAHDGQYKAGLHAHSTNSDGNNKMADMVEAHYARGYDLLAMTDHNYLTRAWSLVRSGKLDVAREAEILAGTDRGGRAMIPIPFTDEHSYSRHVNTFWADFGDQPGNNLERALLKCEELGGLSHINHPGRYTGGNAGGSAGAAASMKESTVQKYVDLFMEYDSCLGMEIINRLDDDSRSDRILWDQVLMRTMPEGRPVFAFASDDSHRVNAVGYAWNVILAPEATDGFAREALEAGAFYAVSRVCRLEGINDTMPNGGRMQSYGTSNTLYLLDQPVPAITRVIVDEREGTITVEGEKCDVIEWIADGEVIWAGETLRLTDHLSEIHSYVRVQLKSETGIAFTQPFGVSILP